jgi:hypothetical protein
MFAVRVSSYRLLLLLRRRVVFVVAPYPVAPRLPLTPQGRPALAALQYNTVFNQAIGDWDVSSVTDMLGMFQVRVFSSRVLLVLRRCVVVVPHHPSPPSAIALTPHDFPTLAALQEATAFDQDISGWNVAAVTSCSQFSLNSGLAATSPPNPNFGSPPTCGTPY